jgi:23S rRNA (cytidine1920-2'-O)/16S rRNA (cytidine1409-2'-O)-methyltransferase
MKERLDILLTNLGLVKSRTAAVTLIKQGSVLVDGLKIEKPSTKVSPAAKIELTENLPFVSRAGQKLAHALEYFKINVTDLVALDIGSSTGGFTDCLLQNNIKKVYAVDVGTEQLDQSLRGNPKVIVMEQTDIRDANIPEKVDLIVIDVSFISLSHVFPVLQNFLGERGQVIALIKPQFEVGRENIDKKGIVTDEKLREKVIENIKELSQKFNFTVQGVIESPITGSTGNVEYLIHLTK